MVNVGRGLGGVGHLLEAGRGRHQNGLGRSGKTGCRSHVDDRLSGEGLIVRERAHRGRRGARRRRRNALVDDDLAVAVDRRSLVGGDLEPLLGDRQCLRLVLRLTGGDDRRGEQVGHRNEHDHQDGERHDDLDEGEPLVEVSRACSLRRGGSMSEERSHWSTLRPFSWLPIAPMSGPAIPFHGFAGVALPGEGRNADLGCGLDVMALKAG